ncbi:MAG TPA: riboflavin synthase [Gemmatimonadaceae bacterium]|nr:riboflavin synthase [Gemmatimonadaceae bacterium]
MFTGIVDDVGTIERATVTEAGRELRIRTRYTDLADGESIACNGACLTVREHGEGWFTVAAVVTTLGRTTVESWRAGDRVNLERAMSLGDRFGGHIVQGHVDCVGTVTSVRRERDALLVTVSVPEEIALLMVPHGSVTVDGVSLTVNRLLGDDGFELSIIEYTERHTTLGTLGVGSRVHVEADMIAKHVQRLFAAQRAALT